MASGSTTWVTVIGSVASVVATAALGWLTPAWNWLVGIGVTLLAHLRGTSALPNWLMYVLLLIAAQSLIRWAWRLMANSKNNFRRYNKDNFFGAEWRWHFMSGHPIGVWAYCQRCGTQLVYESHGGMYAM